MFLAVEPSSAAGCLCDLSGTCGVSDWMVRYGTQVVRTRKILEVHIDKGMTDDQRITFSGEGDQEPGLEPGDIIIVLDEVEHATFK